MFEVWKGDETQSLFSSFCPNIPARKTIQNSCCFLLQAVVILVGKIWEIYNIYTSLNYGLFLRLYPMGLQDGSFKGFPFCTSPLSHLPRSMIQGRYIYIHIFFFSMAALQKQRGGPGRVNSLPSSISHSSDFQSEIPGVSWGQRYRQESLSDMSLLPHWLPQAHWNTSGHLILCPTDRETVLWRNYGPDYVRFSSLPLKLRGNSLILRFVVLYFNKRNPSVFFLHTFFLIFLWGFRRHY